MTIEIANKSHLNQLLLLANQAFGENFTTQQELETYIDHPNHYLLVALIDNDVAGYITASVCNVGELENELLQKVVLPLKQSEIGWIKHVVVHPNHFRKGIAHHLLQAITKQLKPNSDVLFCISWKKGAVTPMSNLLLKNNFNLHQTITNYWYNDSLTKQYNCSVCGTPPCKCSAELFFS